MANDSCVSLCLGWDFHHSTEGQKWNLDGKWGGANWLFFVYAATSILHFLCFIHSLGGWSPLIASSRLCCSWILGSSQPGLGTCRRLEHGRKAVEVRCFCTALCWSHSSCRLSAWLQPRPVDPPPLFTPLCPLLGSSFSRVEMVFCLVPIHTSASRPSIEASWCEPCRASSVSYCYLTGLSPFPPLSPEVQRNRNIASIISVCKDDLVVKC